MKRLFYLLVLLALQSCVSKTNQADLIFESVDPLQKVFPESSYFPPTEAHADVARGEHASFQFVVRAAAGISELSMELGSLSNGKESLSDIKTGFVGFIKVGRANPEPSKDSYSPISGYFPDPIIYKKSCDVPFGTTQPLWVTVKIPVNASTGTYTGKINISGKINGKRFTKSRDLSVTVYKPVIEKTSLWVSNWFFLDRLKYLNNNQEVKKYSELYWELSRVMAQMLADYRQNVAMISPLDLTQFKYENDQWEFDFTNFNKMVKLFIDEGVIGRLEGGHFGGRIDGGWSSPFGLNVPVLGNDSIDKEILPLENPKVRKFYTSFLPALYQNIQQHGWADQYIQHIADEPIDDNVASYIQISKFIKNLLPEVKIIEACHTHQLENMVDVWVPQMNFLRDGLDFYTNQQAKGSEAWFYTCLSPKGEFANRFIELPLIKTRLLHWVNFKYKIPGYLHWGFNYWGSGGGISASDNPYEDASGMIVSSGNILPGGDCWIVYPGDKVIYPSIRLEAMRDGIVDYELLKMYQDKFPDQAKEMVGTTVYGFEHYDINILAFRKKRKEMLEALSQ